MLSCTVLSVTNSDVCNMCRSADQLGACLTEHYTFTRRNNTNESSTSQTDDMQTLAKEHFRLVIYDTYSILSTGRRSNSHAGYGQIAKTPGRA